MDLDCLLALIDDLRAESREKSVIVEGKKDRDALKSFGITNVNCLQQGDTITDFCYSLSRTSSHVILLLDNDRKGQFLTSRVARQLRDCGTRVDLTYRKRLHGFGLRFVENLPGLVERYRENGGKENGEIKYRHSEVCDSR